MIIFVLQALASISEQAKSIGLLSKSSTNLVKENHQTTDPTVIRSMIIDDLVITPMDDEKDEIEKLADGNFTTIEDAMDKLMHLAQLYDDLTKTAEKVSRIFKDSIEISLEYFQFFICPLK
jgi:hypothetical protein